MDLDYDELKEEVDEYLVENGYEHVLTIFELGENNWAAEIYEDPLELLEELEGEEVREDVSKGLEEHMMSNILYGGSETGKASGGELDSVVSD